MFTSQGGDETQDLETSLSCQAGDASLILPLERFIYISQGRRNQNPSQGPKVFLPLSQMSGGAGPPLYKYPDPYSQGSFTYSTDPSMCRMTPVSHCMSRG